VCSNLGWKIFGRELAGVVGRYPELAVREGFVVLSKATPGN